MARFSHIQLSEAMLKWLILIKKMGIRYLMDISRGEALNGTKIVRLLFEIRVKNAASWPIYKELLTAI